MSPSILISLVVVLVVVVGAYVGYKRFIAGLAPDANVRQVNGARLTSDRLHALPTPPWRFAFEIAENKLGGIDHVIIGPSGVIAVTTVMADRPLPGTSPDPHEIGAAAMLRAPVDELAQHAGLSCNMLAKVFWGAAQPGLPAAYETMHATVAVEGQRLTEWLSTLPPGPLVPAQIDLAWQAVLAGIGRPDPLA